MNKQPNSDLPANSDAKPAPKQPIAIVGMGCRFPGANGPEAFWKLLTEAGDGIGEVPDDRFDIDTVYDPSPGAPGKISSRLGGFLDRGDQFDASFFQISPREALRMDPQQRLLLEVAWESLEDAGQAPERLAGESIGVFVGACASDYENIQYYLRDPKEIDLYVSTGTARSVMSGRLSYVFDLRGPSVTIDTACSSSLVAVHLACQSIWSGECKMALAGGVNLVLLPEITMSFSRAKMIAPEGRCRFGDADAEGFIRSEGVGVIVLKPLSLALRDGDSIYAVIRGSAVNNDGRSSGLLATPSREGQQAVLRQAYLNAGISPGDVHYVEAHGTGTRVGDPIEVESLGTVLAVDRRKESRCRIGSVKSNIGHTEAAAGIAGLIKVALCLKYKAIPPSLHYKIPNPNIPWDNLAVEVSPDLIEWPTSDTARAGVSAFGISGTNAHVVLEESPLNSQPQSDSAEQGPDSYLMTLSAKSPEALADLARSYRELVVSDTAGLRDICYSATVRRSHHDHRLAAVVRSNEELSGNLDGFLRSQFRPGMFSGRVTPGSRPKVVFVYSGQGSQWAGMGRGLLREPAFQEALKRCDQAIRRHVNWSVIEELTADESQSHLDQIEVVQPCLFAIQVALSHLWRCWNVRPDVVVGQSMGEVAAAHIAGALSLEDAARVICLRSRLLKRASGQGGMLVVGLPLDEARAALAGYEDLVSIAVSSSPISTVLSGYTAALEEISLTLQNGGVFTQPVKVDVASHSPLMEPLRAELCRQLAGIDARVASTPIYSTVTGGLAPDEPVFDTQYWVRNLREPVLFSSTIERLIESGHNIFVEISPHPVLLTPIQQVMRPTGKTGTVLPSMRCGEDERAVMLGSLGGLYSLGVTAQFDGLFPSGGTLVRLPSYPWQHERFLLAAERSKAGINGQSPNSPAAGPAWQWSARLESAAHPGTYFFEIDFSSELLDYLGDHRIQGSVVLPGAAYVDLVLTAATSIFGDKPFALENVKFKRALFFDSGQVHRLQLIISRDIPEGRLSFQFYSVPSVDEARSPYAEGTILIDEAAAPPRTASIAQIRDRCSEYSSQREFYRSLADRGLEYGPCFQGVQHLWRGGDEALSQMCAPERAGRRGNSRIDPAFLDAAFQTLAATLLRSDKVETYLPVGIDSLRIHSSSPEGALSYACLRSSLEADQDILEGDVMVLDESGNALIEARGLRVRRLMPGAARGSKQNFDDLFYKIAWNPSPLSGNHLSASVPDQKGAWIVFADKQGVGGEVVQSLESCGETCITVVAGEGFAALGPGLYQIDAGDPENYQLLFEQALRALKPRLRGVVHLWSLDLPREPGPMELPEAVNEIGCGSVLLLIQAAAKISEEAGFRLWLVTSRAQAVGAQSECVEFVQSSLWGLGRVVAHEHPELRSTLVDLDGTGGDSSRSLFNELLAGDQETQIAFRKQDRYVARLAHYSARGDLDESFDRQIQLRPDGTYLVTGGLGGLGLAVAEWMIERGARHLVLIGRSDPSPAASETLDGLKRRANVAVVKADVSRTDQVADVVTNIERSMPALKGIVHAAGVLDDGILLQLNAERFEKVMAPKMGGAWNLHIFTLNRPLDFFVLFSSAASLLGPAGQGNYSAANAFLDGLAYYRRSLGLSALSVNWGRWSDVGLAARPDRNRRLELRGIRSFTPEEGLQALTRLMVEDCTQAGVMPFDFDHWSEFYPTCRDLAFYEEVKELQAKGDSVGQRAVKETELTRKMLLAINHEDRPTHIEAYLGRQLARVLAVPESSLASLDTDQPLTRYGVDSLMAIELRGRIDADLGASIRVVSFLNGSSLAQIARQVLDEISNDSLAHDVQNDQWNGYWPMDSAVDNHQEEFTL